MYYEEANFSHRPSRERALSPGHIN